jgi:hypothetical protein
MAQHKFEAFCHCAITPNRIGAHPILIIPYPTGRLFWGGAIPRHFVPGRLRRLRRTRQPGVCATTFYGRDIGFAESGYDRAVPLGHFATASSLAVLFVGETFNHEGVHLLKPGVREFLCKLSTDTEANDN